MYEVPYTDTIKPEVLPYLPMPKPGYVLKRNELIMLSKRSDGVIVSRIAFGKWLLDECKTCVAWHQYPLAQRKRSPFCLFTMHLRLSKSISVSL